MERSASPVLKVKLPARVYTRKRNRPTQTSNTFTSQPSCLNYNLPDHNLTMLPEDGTTSLHQHSSIGVTEMQKLYNYTATKDTRSIESRIKQETNYATLDSQNLDFRIKQEPNYTATVDTQNVVSRIKEEPNYTAAIETQNVVSRIKQEPNYTAATETHNLESRIKPEPNYTAAIDTQNLDSIIKQEPLEESDNKEMLEIGETELQKTQEYLMLDEIGQMPDESDLPHNITVPDGFECSSTGCDNIADMEENIELDVIQSKARKRKSEPKKLKAITRYVLVERSPAVPSEECEQTLLNSSELQLHRRNVSRYATDDVNSTSSRYSNSACDSQEKRKYQSTNSRKLKCNQCEFRTANKIFLVSHLKTHNEIQSFKCNQCDYCTVYNSNLKTHLKTHTGDKPFKCEYCNYRTAYENQLIRHWKVHTGEKPFKCNYCKFSTLYRHYLNSHLKVHTGERPFKCKRCNFSTSHKSFLTTHLKIHTGEKPFKCNHCGYCTVYKNILQKHLKTHYYICTSSDRMVSSVP